MASREGKGIGYGGRKLKEMLRESERLYKETGYYYGVSELRLREEDLLKYERFHSRLLSAVIGARESVKFIAASPTVREYGELVFGLYTPEGDAVALSTGIMVHVHTMSAFIKYLIENDYEENPGIRPGDIFTNNETWAGGVHTADVQTVIPIFYKGELIGWAGGVTHELEAGAHEHGSMPIFAPERFSEGHHISAEKTGENDEYYKHYIKRLSVASRMPNAWILDEKARLAGSIMIREEVYKVIEDFGLEYYMRAIRELIEENRRNFIAKVKERLVPGRYKGINVISFTLKTAYAHPLTEEKVRSLIPVEITIDVTGKMHIDFDGATRPGYHVYNCTPSAMDGGLWVLLSQVLAYDGKVNDGAYIAVTQNLPEGTIVNTDYPYAGTAITWGTLIPTYAAVGGLLSIGFYARGFLEEVFLPSAANSLYNGGGENQLGEVVGFSVFEMAANQSGARGVLDGIDAGYAIWNPEADQGNVELWEMLAPIVYLGRRFIPNTHGYGRFRGGNGWASLWLIWRTQRFNVGCNGHMPTLPYLKGLFGGYPPPSWFGITVKNTNILELIGKGEVPGSIMEVIDMVKEGKLKGDLVIHRTPFWEDVKQGDLMGIYYTGGVGFGDPIERDPSLIIKDLENGFLTEEWAEKVYGVICRYDEKEKKWVVDEKATDEKRRRIREERLSKGVPVKEWWVKEREKVAAGRLPEDVKEMIRDSMSRSEKMAKEFREFWQLPEDFTL